MKILVTAFGPFDGRAENASSLALTQLKKGFPKIHTRVLPVDSVIAPSRLKQALRIIQPEVVILLGEAAGSRAIRLESTAWNELDFRIPDLAGRQPMSRPIRDGASASHGSTLPLNQIQKRLRSHKHPTELSSDPGRYLCNQVFFTALDFLEAQSIPCRAGFIHLPLAEDYATERAVEALGWVIRSL
jgi:pyroglutamyl-peptidase